MLYEVYYLKKRGNDTEGPIMLQIYNQQGLWYHRVEIELRASNEASVKLSYFGVSKMLLHNTKGCSNSKDVPHRGKVSEGCFPLFLPVYSTSRAKSGA